MRKLLALYLLPFLTAFVIVYFLSLQPRVNRFLFPADSQPGPDTLLGFIPAFSERESLAQQFLWKRSPAEDVVFLIGSSELQDASDAVPYRFIPAHSGTRVQAYGHAGNQCFSVFCQLLAHPGRLKNTRIVFILSPGWFEAKPAMGTTSPVFLDYVLPGFMEKINENTSPFSAYASKRIAQIFSEFNAPNLPLKINYFAYMRTLSPFHYIVFSPVLFLDKKQNSYYKKINNSVGNDAGSFAPLSFYNNQPAALPVPWDTMLQKGRDSVLARATNNSMGINNEYYNAHIKGKNGRIKAVDFEHNTELKDFRMLMKLIRAYEVDAYFVMQPLNPHYYTNLKDLNPVIDEVRKEIKGGRGERAYDCADFFVTDTARYDKALLTDVMHFSEYGWHLVNRAVMNHYALK